MEVSFPEPRAHSDLGQAIASFKDEDSYALPNRFEVLITRPGSNATESKKVSMRCESVSLPGRNLNTVTDGNPYGPTREVVDGVTYAEDITMIFQASAGLDERIFFEKWQELAFNKQTWNVGYYKDYVKTVEIYLLDRQDQRRYGIKLVEAFPKTIGPTDLSQSTNNEIIKISVSFSFRYWESLDANRQPSNLTNNNYLNTAINSVGLNIAANLPATVKKLNPFSFPIGPGNGLL
jgi:hypothetical protein